MKKLRKRDPFERMFPHAKARQAADDAAEAAWIREPGIALVRVCIVWNDTYAAHAPHPGSRAT